VFDGSIRYSTINDDDELVAERNCANRSRSSRYFVVVLHRLVAQSGRSHAMTTVRDDALAPVAVPGHEVVGARRLVSLVGVDGTVLRSHCPPSQSAEDDGVESSMFVGYFSCSRPPYFPDALSLRVFAIAN